MKRHLPFAALAAAGLAACAGPVDAPLEPSLNQGRAGNGTVWVTSDADAGAGSFRAAVAVANSDPSVRAIRFRRGVGRIGLASTVEFSGPQDLEVAAAGTTLDGAALPIGASGFTISGGGELTLRNLTVKNAPGTGITVAIPATAHGVIRITLDDVTAYGNGGHGVLVNDQTGYFADPNSTAGDGSDAGLEVLVFGSRFENNGFAAIDQDGLRINEGGAGDLTAVIRGTEVLGNGGDGVELDERGPGSAVFDVERTSLDRNGGFDPSDYDDGIDVDEAGDGDVIGRFRQVTASGNFEQGVDLNENDAGDLRVDMTRVVANDNLEEGIEFEEDDDFAGGGDIVSTLVQVTTLRNGTADGDAGLKLREKGPGNLRTRIIGATASGNTPIGGLLLREDADGDLDAEILGATADENGDYGIRFDENGAGNLDARLVLARTVGNLDIGVRAEQQASAATDSGILRIRRLHAEGNVGGDLVVEPTVVADRQP